MTHVGFSSSRGFERSSLSSSDKRFKLSSLLLPCGKLAMTATCEQCTHKGHPVNTKQWHKCHLVGYDSKE